MQSKVDKLEGQVASLEFAKAMISAKPFLPQYAASQSSTAAT
jgi:hypothetical protein